MPVCWTVLPAPVVSVFGADALLIALQQIVIGVALGFVLQMAFNALIFAGQAMAYSMGLGFASMMDPTNGVQVPVVAQFWLILAMLAFLMLNGHLVLISAIVETFSVLPRLLRDSIVVEAWEGGHNVLCAQVLRDARRFAIHEALFEAPRDAAVDQHPAAGAALLSAEAEGGDACAAHAVGRRCRADRTHCRDGVDTPACPPGGALGLESEVGLVCRRSVHREGRDSLHLLRRHGGASQRAQAPPQALSGREQSVAEAGGLSLPL